MDVLLLLVPMSVVLVLLIGVAFLWSVRSGQFDDLDGPAHRILADDDLPPERRERDLTRINPAPRPPA